MKNAFIEGLTHNSYVIQVQLLKQSVQTKLEALLSLFDQSLQSTESYILSFPDKLPDLEILRKMIRRLQNAGVSEELRKKAEIENEVETSFKTMARQIQEKDKALEENKRALEEKEKLIAELMKKISQ